MCLLVKLLGIGGMDVVILAVGVYQMVSQPIVSPSPGILKDFPARQRERWKICSKICVRNREKMHFVSLKYHKFIILYHKCGISL